MAALADKVRVSGPSTGNRGTALLDLRAKLRPSSITIEEIFRPLLDKAIERWEALPGPVQRTRAAFTDGSMYFTETPFARCGYAVHFPSDDGEDPVVVSFEGPLPGEYQDINRAELFAAMKLLVSVTDFNVQWHSDSKYTIQGILQLLADLLLRCSLRCPHAS